MRDRIYNRDHLGTNSTTTSAASCDWFGRSTCCIEAIVGNALPIPPPGFDDLNVDDQIDYLQALWDRIAAKEDVVPVPNWHRDILDEKLRVELAHLRWREWPCAQR